MPSAVDEIYDAFVEQLASSGDSRTISNSSSRHALSILRAIFKHSSQSIKLFSGNVEPSVYNDQKLLEEAKKFVQDRQGKIELLIQNPEEVDCDSNLFLKELCEFSTENVSIKSVSANHPLKKSSAHFVVADAKSYRVETNVKAHTAICCFKDEERARGLLAIFESAFSSPMATDYKFA